MDSTNILDLPSEMLQHIFTLCSFHHVANLRQVCRRFDAESRVVLNRGRRKLIEAHKKVYAAEKAKLKSGPPDNNLDKVKGRLVQIKHVDIYLDKLCEAYDRHVEPANRCFIAGKVLDMLAEFVRRVVLANDSCRVEGWDTLYSTCQMAQEHFQDHVLPLKIGFKPSRFKFALAQKGRKTSADQSPILSLQPELRERIFSFLPFNEISKLREVCQTLNFECQGILNRGVTIAMEDIDERMRCLRTVSPRDPLDRLLSYNGIVLSAWEELDTQLEQLYHAYACADERKRTCFIAGRVIDETNRFRFHPTDVFLHLEELEMSSKKVKMARRHFKSGLVSETTKLQLLK